MGVAHLARCRRLQRVLERAGKVREAESLKHVLDQVDDHFTVIPPPKMPGGMPAFTVEVVSNYNGSGRLVRWCDRGVINSLVGNATGNYEGRELYYGKFACYPVHDGGALVAPEPEPAPVTRSPWPFPTSVHADPT